MKIDLLKFTQPIGDFYIGVASAKDILEIATVEPRRWDPVKRLTFGGAQRPESAKRVSEIAEYCSDPDAAFPTPIVIAIEEDAKYEFNGKTLVFTGDQPIGRVLDGQHRLKGIEKSGKSLDFQLPIVVVFDLSEEQQAYIFTIINSKQTRVSMSIIYDLFEIAESRSPQKTCHEIAKLFNSSPQSPFCGRLKMLGTKEGEQESLSQGIFVNYLLRQISKKPDSDYSVIKNKGKLEDDASLPLRKYFVTGRDEVIYKILNNYFSAVRDVFPKEWDDSVFVLTKTTGFGALLRALNPILVSLKSNGEYTHRAFLAHFEKAKKKMESAEVKFLSKDFPSNEAEQARLARDFLI